MASRSRSTVNWEPYEGEILTQFVDENKTWGQVKEYMETKCGFSVSVPQYKRRFGSLRNLTSDEWKWTLETIEKRRLDHGKDSEVLFQGHRLGADRIKREKARYQRKIQGNQSIPKPVPCRVEIKTPPPLRSSGPGSSDLILRQNFQRPIRSPSPLSLPQNQVADPSLVDMDMDGFIPRSVINGRAELTPNLDGRLVRFEVSPTVAPVSGTSFQQWHTGLQRGTTSTDVASRLPTALAADLRPFREVIHNRNANRSSAPTPASSLLQMDFTIAAFARHIFSVESFLSTNQGGFQHHAPSDPKDTVNTRLMSSFTKWVFRASNHLFPYEQLETSAIQAMKALVDHMPHKYQEQFSIKVTKALHSSSNNALQITLELMAYFGSNNLVRASDLAEFLNVMTRDEQLAVPKLLQRMKSPTMDAFTERLAEVAIRREDVPLLLGLTECGVDLAGCLTGLIHRGIFRHQISHDYWMQLLPLLQLHTIPAILRNTLLVVAAGSEAVDEARMLLEAGADVNFQYENYVYDPLTSALSQAGRTDNFDMARLLLEYEADINLDHSGQTVLDLVMRRGFLGMVEFLLAHGASFLRPGETRDEALERLLLDSNVGLDVFCILAKGEDLERLPDLMDSASKGSATLQQFLRSQISVSQRMLSIALLLSIVEENVPVVKTLLDHETDPNIPTLTEKPLIRAMRAKKPDVLYKLLVDAGGNVRGLRIPDEFQFGRFSIVKHLIESGVDIKESKFGTDALVGACLQKSFAVVACILDRGVDINRVSELHKLTPLQASLFPQRDWPNYRDGPQVRQALAEYLIYRGANVNYPAFSQGGRTALQVACHSLSLEVVDMLLSHGAEVNAPAATHDGYTALEASCSRGNYDIFWSETDEKTFSRLLDAGVTIPRCKRRRDRLICNIIARGSLDNLKRVLLHKNESDSNISVEDKHLEYQRSSLQAAVGTSRQTCWDFLKLLIQHGEDVNAPPVPHYGRTPLQQATESPMQSIELAEYLLEHGADVNADPAEVGGITALQGAAIAGNLKLAELFLEKGANVNAKPSAKEGRYAIEGAAEHGRLDMVQLLLNHGARGDVHNGRGFERAIELAEWAGFFAIGRVL